MYGAWFTRIVGILLTITAAGKVWAALDGSSVLATTDPIFGLPLRGLFLGTAIVEIVIAGMCFFSKCRVSARAIAWLATGFLFYRIGLWLNHWGPCPCFGNLTKRLHLSPEIADVAAQWVLVFLLVGSYGIVFFDLKQHLRLPALSRNLERKEL